ncbi:MAG: hypothetical protein ACE5I7_19465, partial [Candidatus Binatia bacterium]
MTYLDFQRLRELDAVPFQAGKPFPWINPDRLLTEEGYQRLVETLPHVSLFERSFGKKRKFGQRYHDRYALEYRDDLQVATPWKDFVAELRGEEYRAFVRRMLGIDRFDLNCHWHYAPSGCSVSPHCDAKRKHGSHVFYFNTPQEWDPDWGGQTLVLDDDGRLNHRCNPEFEDLKCVAASQALGNYSLLFKRGEHSWHGVREDSSVMLIDCGRMASVWTLEAAQRMRKETLLAKARAVPGLRGYLAPEWNARDQEYVPGRSKLLHWTILHTQPWRPAPRRFIYQHNPVGYVWFNLKRSADIAGYQEFSFARPSAVYTDLIDHLRAARRHPGGGCAAASPNLPAQTEGL